MSEHVLLAAYHKRMTSAQSPKNALVENAEAYAKNDIVDEKAAEILTECEYAATCADSGCEGCVKRKNDGGDAEPAVCAKGIKTDFTIQWKSEQCPYLYNSHDYAVIPDIPQRFKTMKAEVLMNSIFFACFCEKWYNGTRRLILQGADLLPRIGRRFQDWDVPYLIIFLRANKDVVSLNLAYNNIHCAGFINLLDYIIAHKHILELNIQNNNIRAPGINHLCEAGENIMLKTLRLNGNKFGVESAKQVALLLPKNRYLRYLDVAEVDQTASSLTYFTTVMRWDQEECNKTLKILDLSRPNPGCMYSFDSTHFASVIGCMLRFNRCLVELHLQKYNFSCHDIEIMLEDLKYNDTLHLLDLCNNNIGDHGMEKIANWLKTRPSLSGLLLAHNIITSHGARALSFGMPFSRIRMLDISYNKITDVGATNVLNTIKKSTLLRYLRIFGNCLGHCTAKIVERMLVSGVLVQENIDVKPYRVDHKWSIAHYPSDRYKQRYYDVPRYAFPQPLKIRHVKNTMSGKAAPKVHFKYIDPVPIEDRRRPVLVKNTQICKEHLVSCVCYDCRDDEVINSLAPSGTDIVPEACVCSVCTFEIEPQKPSTFQSDITLIQKLSCGCLPDDCACCYCMDCEAKKDDLCLSQRNEHPTECNCCDCGAEEVEYASSSISTKSNELHDYPDGVDQLKKIALILERVDTEMQQHILKWINIDKDILNPDLAMSKLDMKIGEMDKREERKASACNHCSLASSPLEMQTVIPEPMFSINYANVCCEKGGSRSGIDSSVRIASNKESGLDKIASECKTGRKITH